MIKIALLSLAAVGVLSWGWQSAIEARSAEEAAVRVPIENYFKGHATGDGAYIRKAFHPAAKVFAMRDGKLLELTAEEFASRFDGKPPADEAERKRRIESIDITGNAAVVKVVLDYPQVKFTDYMSLLKVDGEWKIVNKTFFADRKPGA
ncbi:MAG TPA: nuclear transport factor 2 family protein [Blastocatellia bacterium]|nr:nuclear transport factor 2 family protein [Blastocatellia bacterium]